MIHGNNNHNPNYSNLWLEESVLATVVNSFQYWYSLNVHTAFLSRNNLTHDILLKKILSKESPCICVSYEFSKYSANTSLHNFTMWSL
jgi:hypothetical protein